LTDQTKIKYAPHQFIMFNTIKRLLVGRLAWLMMIKIVNSLCKASIMWLQCFSNLLPDSNTDCAPRISVIFPSFNGSLLLPISYQRFLTLTGLQCTFVQILISRQQTLSYWNVLYIAVSGAHSILSIMVVLSFKTRLFMLNTTSFLINVQVVFS